jgi:hypothetical protein
MRANGVRSLDVSCCGGTITVIGIVGGTAAKGTKPTDAG